MTPNNFNNSKFENILQKMNLPLEANDNNATHFLTSASQTLITQIKIIHNSEKFYILYNKDLFCSFTNNQKLNVIILNVQIAVSELLLIKLVYSPKAQMFWDYFYNKLWEKFNWKYEAQSDIFHWISLID